MGGARWHSHPYTGKHSVTRNEVGLPSRGLPDKLPEDSSGDVEYHFSGREKA